MPASTPLTARLVRTCARACTASRFGSGGGYGMQFGSMTRKWGGTGGGRVLVSATGQVWLAEASRVSANGQNYYQYAQYYSGNAQAWPVRPAA